MAYVDPFNIATPADPDALAQGDDEIRLLKRAIKERLERFFADVNVDPMAPKPGIIKTADIAALNITNALLAALSVTTDKVALLAITEALLANLAVTTPKVADLAITGPKVAALAIGTGHVADLAITNAKINDVSGAKLAALSVPTGAMADRSISSIKIALLGVITELLGDLSVTEPKLANNAVTNVKVLDATLEIAKLSAAAKGLIAHMKSASLAVVAGSHGSDTITSVGTVPLVGAVVGDSVTVGRPNIATWTHAQRTNRWDAVVSAAGIVELYVANMSGGLKDWPAFNATVHITKSLSAWGL